MNIGGEKKIATTWSTLTKFPSSTLGWMFSGKHELKKHEDRVFIDRDGEPFVNMLSYLWQDKIPPFNSNIEE